MPTGRSPEALKRRRAKRRAINMMKPALRRRIKRELMEAQNHRCCLCGWVLNELPKPGLDPIDWTASFEHIIPVGEGGKDRWDNWAISHVICNLMRAINGN